MLKINSFGLFLLSPLFFNSANILHGSFNNSNQSLSNSTNSFGVVNPTTNNTTSSSSSGSDEHKTIDMVCNKHSLKDLETEELTPEKLKPTEKDFWSRTLVYGFIREFESKEKKPAIPKAIKNLCLYFFSMRRSPCDCIKEKYLQLDMGGDQYRKNALFFCLTYKIEGFKDELDRTILHYACMDGHLGLAKLLKEWGANINAKDEDGYNALHFACFFSSNVNMVTWLLDVCKIDIESKGDGQKTPFLCAAVTGQLSVAKLLKQRGADINAKATYGNNALHAACASSGSVDMVTWLLDVCKIDIESEGYREMTSFLYTALQGQLEIAKLLQERGANIYATMGYSKINALAFAEYEYEDYKDKKKMIRYLKSLEPTSSCLPDVHFCSRAVLSLLNLPLSFLL